VGTGFSLKSRSNLLNPITFHDFGLLQSKVIVIWHFRTARGGFQNRLSWIFGPLLKVGTLFFDQMFMQTLKVIGHLARGIFNLMRGQEAYQPASMRNQIRRRARFRFFDLSKKYFCQ
jgi:uncharacterized membrane protein